MFVVYDEQMNIIPFPDGVKPLDIFMSSISKERVTGNIEGAHGTEDYGFIYKERDIELYMLLQSRDTEDYRLLRDAVYEMFDNDKIYVAETYQPGKRYLVSISEKYIPNRVPNNRRFADATIKCSKVDLPFAESIKTTKEIEKNGLKYGDGWHYGMGLLYDDESHKYTHAGKKFRIYNAGSKSIHPFKQDLKITINNVQGSTDYFQLENKTNKTKLRVSEAVGNNHEIVIDGPNVTRNGAQFLRKTTKEYIELAPGWNTFEVTGAASAKVEFDFRFYY